MLKSIRAKLGAGFAVVIALGLVTGALGLGNAKLIRESAEINEHTRRVLRDVASIRESMVNIETGQRGFSVTGYDTYLEPYNQGIAEIETQFDQVIQLTSDNAAQTERLEALREMYGNWLNLSINKTIEIRRSLSRQEIDQTEFMNRYTALSGKPIMDKMRGLIGEIEQEELGLLEKRKKESNSAYNTALWSVGTSLALSLLIGVMATLSLIKLLQSKLGVANKHINALANGHLNSQIESNNNDEVDQLLTALAKAQDNLRKLIDGIRQSALELSSSATQVKESSSTMANAGLEQADATSSMAAAVEELTVSISQISENSSEATDTANAAKESADNGMVTLGEVVNGIQRIARAVEKSAAAVQSLEKQSADISEIVSAITEIADRTNLLALNAAIEAARAGEQGRGFAVVADEVRKLAEQTKASTDRISGMVSEIQSITQGAVTAMDTSVQLVKEGIDQADVVNVTIQKIKADSDKVSEAIAAIAISMKEQSNVSIEISRNVERVAQMTEENTASAQQNTQVATHLSSVSQSMMNSVKVFKTE
ncbi:MAG: CHASE3 domain-containing protein [Gammaproteobacteria bacterium]|uniref:methyl-accepting chemotaxis protein n=1 Tax=Limnobacter sp. TaxID=2003368 RepID=UPI001D749498|nr:methyl-accepting chemotaxis protein [Limnobacter sp.]MBU0784178.1 CHASE3 domain-containing protein [Gammaproteobacteria bacterium]MBU0848219.1 CHASE3 domain-containing protein [Gammaproteobacteria bacterium]MBU1266913.1 CHASE3 domain-containing protein [Gammaproteobacteria bacterium]MBU1528426.1 CHASE3 domain-containing protein [Gammaproteobacteria bacterium]MBU1779115.1 CHASE3 domain-containing protein [Gammaproteobacteria bacterium]